MDIFLLKEHSIALENYKVYLDILAEGAGIANMPIVHALYQDVALAYQEQIIELNQIIKQMEESKYGESAFALN